MNQFSVKKNKKVVVLGAGPAGISAGFHAKQKGYDVVVFEKEKDYGGLCNSFEINGFTFDTFAHVSFDNNPIPKNLLEGKTDCFLHYPEALNYYQGEWIRNPVQNNLNGLNVEERIEVIKGFVNRKQFPIETYGDWLRNMYGDYFAEHFPNKYTRKYWTVEPKQLEPKWVEGRMYAPTIDEVLLGAMTEETPNVHYSKEIRYPKSGGFQALLAPMASELNIQYEKTVTKIDTNNKFVCFSDGTKSFYDECISTIPLPDLCEAIFNTPDAIVQESEKLDYTSGVMVSLGFNKENISPALWFYIYDEDVNPARIYAPEQKSTNNVPKGCSAIQAEIYFSKYKPMRESLETILEKTIKQLVAMNLFQEDDILIKDVRMKKYANVMFTPDIYSAREKIHKYLLDKNIKVAGRFGEWKYLWIGQSVVSGKNAAKAIY